jgi:NTP pyrophosphatase (non-canonical NTP hydrolase)
MKTRAEMLQEWSDASGGDNLSLEAWADLRKSLLNEECRELCDAIDHFVATGDPKPMAKESADVEYVVIGAAQRPGIDLEVAFKEVHSSNMSKFGPNGEVYEREDGKILKGPNYREADMTAAVSGSEDLLGKTETVLDWIEGALRSIPPVTKAVLIIFLACALSALAINSGYLLAGGR